MSVTYDIMFDMIETIYPLNISGKWNISVDTPFGKEQYTLNIDNTNGRLAGSVSHEKGDASLSELSFLDGTFICLLNVDYPIKATVYLKASVIDNNKMFGTLQIDQYLETLFIGSR
jgi:hypothetical protein